MGVQSCEKNELIKNKCRTEYAKRERKGKV